MLPPMSKVNEFYKHKGRTRRCLYFYVFFVCFVSLCLLFFIRGNIVDKHFLFFIRLTILLHAKYKHSQFCEYLKKILSLLLQRAGYEYLFQIRIVYWKYIKPGNRRIQISPEIIGKYVPVVDTTMKRCIVGTVNEKHHIEF